MVRNLVGVLLAIGREQQEVDWARQVLEARERRLGGVTAKGTGLYFVRARYDLIDLPNRPAGPSFIQPIIARRHEEMKHLHTTCSRPYEATRRHGQLLYSPSSYS